MGQRRQRPALCATAAAATAVLLLSTSGAHGAQQQLRGLSAEGNNRQDGVWYGPDAMLTPVQLLLEDKRASVEYDVEADSRVRPGTTYPNCQWHVKFGFNFTSQGLIDPNAIYYAEILSGPRSGVAYKIKGRFPPAIYFSWQLYNSLFTGEAAQGTTDYKIKPHWGKNPFTDASATPFDTGGYELYLTPSGNEGYPNELRLPRGMTNTLILRMYKPDPIMGEHFPIDQIDPPVLYVGQTLNDGRREWRALPPCSHDQEILVDRAATGLYQVNYPQNTGTFGRGVILRDYNCPLNPKRGNVSFVLFEGAWLTPQVQNLVARQSSDSPYLFYCINPENDWKYYTNTVFKFRFKLPTLPDGLYEPIKVANVGEYDLRYLSIMTAESVLPQPTIEAIDGQGIKRFYHQKQGASWDGWVEVRVALDEQKAKDCGFWDPNAVFLPLTSERVGPAKSITLVVRSVLAHGPKTAGAASRACNKTVNCGNPGFIRNVMQEQYPELEVYQCEGGKLRRYHDYWGAV